VPMIGIVVQLIYSSMAVVTHGVLFWFFVFWLGASVLWSWIDAFFVNARIERFMDELESEILDEIATERLRAR